VIDAALNLIAGQLNQHFRRVFQVTEDMAVTASLFEPDGSPNPLIANRLAVFLTGIERDGTFAQAAPSQPAMGTRLEAYPAVHLNLLVMIAANFAGSSYKEALKFLAGSITFLQGKPIMDHQNAPEMDPSLERLVLAIENLGTQDLHGLWGIHGGRYLPSVLYRVRTVSLDANQVLGRAPSIRQLDTGVMP